VFTVPKVYVQYTGDITTAILLNQIIFYSDKSKRNDGYFYKSYKEWEEEICLSERQVRYSAKKLKNKGILKTKLMKANGSPTVHYKFLFDNFAESILTLCQIPTLQSVGNQSDLLSETLTENTTEITTENTTLIPYVEIIEFLNKSVSTNFRASTPKTRELIKARWNEGFRLDDFKAVIHNKTIEWINNKDMCKYLRPETLFGTKFESYLNQKGGGISGQGNQHHNQYDDVF